MHKIIYFSGTGNTAYVADQIESRLIEKGIPVEKVPVEYAAPRDCSDSECLYFGFPVYGCSAPEPVRRFIEYIPASEGGKVRLFSTLAYFSGGAMTLTAYMFRKKGFRVTSWYERKMPGSDGLAMLKKDGRGAAKMLESLKRDFSDLDGWIDDDENFPARFRTPGIAGKAVGGIMKAAESWIKNKYHADDRCITCGLCSRICPVGNIKLTDQGVVFGNRCCLCMRCVHNCPVEAVQIGKITVNKFRYKGPDGKFKPPERTGE